LDIPTEKHGGTAAQDVETSTLLLNQRSALVAEPITTLQLFNLTHLYADFDISAFHTPKKSSLATELEGVGGGAEELIYSYV